jgi:hypothetical protein
MFPLTTRRTWLQSLVAGLALRRFAQAAKPNTSDAVRTVLAGVRRNEAFQRRYRVNVTVTALGIPFFKRSNVGGGYASVETGSANGITATALQFVAGSLPDRAAGLNRFGLFREAATTKAGVEEQAFVGFITSSKEENLEDARGALKSKGAGTPMALAWGGVTAGSAWFHVGSTEVPLQCTWTQADDVLPELLQAASGLPRHPAPAASTMTFLTAARRAALSKEPSLRTPFFHNGKRYELRTHWKGPVGTEMEGEIRNNKGEKSAEFRNTYKPGDLSGLPITIRYQARSYLHLIFEVDPQTSAAVPSLFEA